MWIHIRNQWFWLQTVRTVLLIEMYGESINITASLRLTYSPFIVKMYATCTPTVSTYKAFDWNSDSWAQVAVQPHIRGSGG